MTEYEKIKIRLKSSPSTWLITGVAGFIGSNLLETLLMLDQRVVGIDNFSTGSQNNLDEVKKIVNPNQWNNFHFVFGDIRNLQDCRNAMNWIKPKVFCCANSTQPESTNDGSVANQDNLIQVEYVLHQAALGSVPRSIVDPISTHESNLNGFLNMLVAARDAKVKSFTYAASSSTYGDHPDLPKVESKIGKPLSPYALTKYVNEIYAEVFNRCYGFSTIGLRYFNVFGKRQNPSGAYAAVIPKWIDAMLNGEPVLINGNGETSRDFCYIENAVQANLLSALATEVAQGQIYNVAIGERTNLNQLYILLKNGLSKNGIETSSKPLHRDFRLGDVLHSQACIEKARNYLGYNPTHKIGDGIDLAVPWYLDHAKNIQ